MRKVLKSIFIVAIMAGTAIFLGLIWNYVESPSETTPQSVIQYVPTPSHDSPEFRKELAKYVYSKSTRISRATSKKIVDEAFRYEQPLCLLSIMKAESKYLPSATGSSGDIGLGQVVFEQHTAALAKLGIAREARDLYDIEVNIRAMNMVFREKMRIAKGNPMQALILYNGKHRPVYHTEILTTFLELSFLWEDRGHSDARKGHTAK